MYYLIGKNKKIYFVSTNNIKNDLKRDECGFCGNVPREKVCLVGWFDWQLFCHLGVLSMYANVVWPLISLASQTLYQIATLGA